MKEREDRESRVDVWERRSIPVSQMELRADSSDELTLTGYASTFQPYEMYGGPASGGWIEQLDQRAFEETLSEKPDLMLLINHEGMPLARTKSGTLALSVDRRGLKVSAKLDRSDPDVQRLEAKMRRKDMDEMSFAFRVKSQAWSATPEFKDDDYALRTITAVNLHKGDVSVVNYGANPTTSAELKSMPELLEEIVARQAELAEVRSVNGGLIDDAVEALSRNVKPAAQPVMVEERADDAPKGMSVHEALTRMGLAAEDGTTLTLAEALAQSE